MNRLIALLMLLLLSPLFVVVALAIYLEDGAPVFFVAFLACTSLGP
jgi:lipopolysaccharide/colanic/teichoic acid biosynthesis glycosyltransferase